MRTRFHRTIRFASVAALPLIFAGATPQPLADGMSYEFVLKSQSRQTNDRETVTLRGRGIYAGDEARIEIIEAASSTGGQDTFGGKGTYFIIKKGGDDMYLVNPAEKSYMKWDMMGMFAMMGQVMNAVGGLVRMEMSDVKIEAQDMGAGEAVHGQPTKHYRLVQNFTMSTRVFGKTSKAKSESTTDYYYAPSLKLKNPFVSNSQGMAMMSQMDVFNNSDYKTQMAAATAKLPKAVPIRTVTKQVDIDEKGKQTVSTSSMEMVNFKTGDFPASTFTIPSDYTLIQMQTVPPNAQRAEGQIPADSARPTSAADEAKKKLRGIFKR